MEKHKGVNNDLQNTTQKTKDRATRTPLKTVDELTQVIQKAKQFLFRIGQPSYYSCYKSGYKSFTWEQSFIYFVVLTTSLR